MSYNIGPSHEDGSYVCELSDSDHKMHPEALAPRNGFTYRATEVILIELQVLNKNAGISKILHQLHRTGESFYKKNIDQKYKKQH